MGAYRDRAGLPRAHDTGAGRESRERDGHVRDRGRARGPTTIDGALSGRTLTLTITRDYGLRETFTGTLTDPAHLVGKIAMGGYTQAFSYAKQ
jgi:hypothetical protein